jgi:hypothetical protein
MNRKSIKSSSSFICVVYLHVVRIDEKKGIYVQIIVHVRRVGSYSIKLGKMQASVRFALGS